MDPSTPDDSNSEAPNDPLVTCAFSGEPHPRSRMLVYGDHFVAPEHKEAFIKRLETGDPALESRGYQDAPLTGEIRLIFRQSLGIMASNWLPIVLTSVLIWLPIDLIYSAIDWHLVDYSYGLEESDLPLSPLQGSLIPYLLNLTIGLVGEACFFLIAHRAWFGRSADFFGLLLPALGVWSRLFRTRILVMLMLVVGFILLVIPGLFLATMLVVSDVAVVAENRRPVSAIQRSYHLVKGKGLLAFFFAIIVSFALIIPQIALNWSWEYLGIESWLVSAILSWIVTLPLVSSPFLFYVLYQHLRANAEAPKEAPDESVTTASSGTPA